MKNYFLEVAKLMLQDNGWTIAPKESGMGENTLFKIEGGSKKQASIEGNTIKFYFQSSYIHSAPIDEMLKRTNSLLNYFIEE
jgi:hypothetical protein